MSAAILPHHQARRRRAIVLRRDVNRHDPVRIGEDLALVPVKLLQPPLRHTRLRLGFRRRFIVLDAHLPRHQRHALSLHFVVELLEILRLQRQRLQAAVVQRLHLAQDRALAVDHPRRSRVDHRPGHRRRLHLRPGFAHCEILPAEQPEGLLLQRLRIRAAIDQLLESDHTRLLPAALGFRCLLRTGDGRAAEANKSETKRKRLHELECALNGPLFIELSRFSEVASSVTRSLGTGPLRYSSSRAARPSVSTMRKPMSGCRVSAGTARRYEASNSCRSRVVKAPPRQVP